jgi:hypothetical protein
VVMTVDKGGLSIIEQQADSLQPLNNPTTPLYLILLPTRVFICLICHTSKPLFFCLEATKQIQLEAMRSSTFTVSASLPSYSNFASIPEGDEANVEEAEE